MVIILWIIILIGKLNKNNCFGEDFIKQRNILLKYFKSSKSTGLTFTFQPVQDTLL